MDIDYSNYYWQNEKLRIRTANENDWETFYANCFDSQSRFLYEAELEPPRDSENAKEFWFQFLKMSSKNNSLNFTIEALDGKFIGNAYMFDIDERNGTFSIGIILDQKMRGQGFGTSAMSILLDYAFNERRLHKYNLYIVEGNTSSETMFKKLGCKHEGVVRETIFHQGKYLNEIHYGITADEFNKNFR